MLRRPPRSTRTDTLFPYTTLFRSVVLPQSEVWHLRGPSWNTREGMRAIQLTREAIALAPLSEETQGALHANGAQPGGLLSITAGLRSEEHTSELQSLMRISYAVFCLKKKTKTTKPPYNRHQY